MVRHCAKRPTTFHNSPPFEPSRRSYPPGCMHLTMDDRRSCQLTQVRFLGEAGVSALGALPPSHIVMHGTFVAVETRAGKINRGRRQGRAKRGPRQENACARGKQDC